MKITWMSLALLPAFVLTAAAPLPADIENKAFDPAKPPIIDEAATSTQYSAPEWRIASAIKAPACGKGAVWKLGASSAIQGIATKEKTVQVKGKFSRFAAFASQNGVTLKGSGVLDLSSWDSGLAPRDFRVQKYVFGAEEPGKAVLPFQFDFKIWNLKAGDWESPLTLKFKLHGQDVSLTFPAKLHADGKSVKVTTVEQKRFTFLTAGQQGAFAKMMELCNHHFLASYADVALDLHFEQVCVK
jgi:hypothetical protein